MKPAYLKLAGRLFAAAGHEDPRHAFLEEALTWGGSDAEVEGKLEELRGARRPPRLLRGQGT